MDRGVGVSWSTCQCLPAAPDRGDERLPWGRLENATLLSHLVVLLGFGIPVAPKLRVDETSVALWLWAAACAGIAILVTGAGMLWLAEAAHDDVTALADAQQRAANLWLAANNASTTFAGVAQVKDDVPGAAGTLANALASGQAAARLRVARAQTAVAEAERPLLRRQRTVTCRRRKWLTRRRRKPASVPWRSGVLRSKRTRAAMNGANDAVPAKRGRQRESRVTRRSKQCTRTLRLPTQLSMPAHAARATSMYAGSVQRGDGCKRSK